MRHSLTVGDMSATWKPISIRFKVKLAHPSKVTI